MEAINLEKDIKIFYVNASSYPEGIMVAHQKLHSIVPFSYERKYFGLSRPENNSGIVYKAATEETFEGEAEKYNCETLIIKKGNYVSIVLNDYRKNLSSIGLAFKELLSHPNIDPQGYCIEWYLSEKEVNCMVRLEK
jgi:hypothetical protein